MNKKVPMTRKGTMVRLLKTLFSFYPVLLPLVLICILFNAAITAMPAIFQQKIIAIVEQTWQSGDWASVFGTIIRLVLTLAVLYTISLIAGVIYTQTMAVITQGSLKKLREKMFGKMEDLPVKYFDTNNHGDIMSHYTNDIDTLRQMISQSIPQTVLVSVTMLTTFCIMLYYSFWMTIVVIVGVLVMVQATKYIAGRSSRYFVKQQKSLGQVEGFVEEIMNGEKVVKVFCHERQTEQDFDKLNEELFGYAREANRHANILMPVLANIGNILYVIVALIGGVLLLLKVPNVSISGLALSISIVVPFLNMTRQFCGSVTQISNQINMVVMGLAGAGRLFQLIDEKPEEDDGYVTLVNATEQDGKMVPCEKRTNTWAWKHPHQDGSITYTKLEGDVRLSDVDFSYDGKKTVLHDITLYAKPGQKVAFVGATGAGKTTITNLINRFYDIADGKIRYDGININKIKKADLRRSLGIVLQETVLFTGTVMENIRYGKLDASDEECIAAAKLAGADDFVRRLPDGYQTMLTANGESLSQGQRQLLAIARAAVADPPVMIMDEATSSIDTRTEAIVQKGMDALMHGRTVFVIAHRLSTVQNADVIMVLDHGQIIERGSHAELIAQKGTYYRLYTGAFELE